ncbi:uncharacterized protein [Dendropsophus ebraccatus]|uniref:uncharacterized protein n=1 Tax=Dendropsophus ebraccatus TaxID=150705 RepID=UPI00383122C1
MARRAEHGGAGRGRRGSWQRDIDVPRLIAEVRSRPHLWDLTVRGYHDRVLRRETWESIAALVVPQWGDVTDSEQLRMVRAVETRWSSVRDQYQRAIRTEERGGEPISMRYAPLLDFIPSRSQRQTSGNFSDPPGGQDAAGSDVAASQQEGDSATPPPSQEPGSPTLSEGTEPMPGPSGSTSMHEEEEAAAPSTSGAGPSGVPLAARPRQPLTRPTTTTTRRRREQEENMQSLV